MYHVKPHHVCHILSTVFLIAATLLTGCGGELQGGEAESEWTVADEELTLSEDLFVSDDGDFYFGRIYDIAVRGDGRIYVTDPGAYHVKVLSPDGAPLDSIGTRGEGPGEFERPSDVVLARGDSLYVLDGYRGRVSVFAPDHSFAYSFMARGDGGVPSFPRAMMVPEEGSEMLFAYSPGSRMVATEGAQATVRPASPGGAVGDTLFTARPYQIAWKDQGGMRMTFTSIPFARASHYALGPEGHVHHAWSDSMRVAVYSQTGEPLRVVEIPFEPVPVSEADRERELEGRRAESRAMVEGEIPDTKPAFDDFLIDGGGRYWFKRPTADPDTADWWIADPDVQRVRVAPLPSTVDLKAVQGDFAYGSAQSPEGAPALVRYRITEK